MDLKQLAGDRQKKKVVTLSYRCRDFLKTGVLGVTTLLRPGSSRPGTLSRKGATVLRTAGTIAIMKKVCDWQLQERRRSQNGSLTGHFSALVHLDPMPHSNHHWGTATLYIGIMAVYHARGDRQYLQEALKLAQHNRWQPGPRLRHADDHCMGQLYLELYFIKKDPRMIAPMRETFDRIMAEPQPGREDWWWCDALFMAPPVLARLSAATGERKYLDFMNQMWWDATGFLYDPSEQLFFRDQSFKVEPDGSGPREKNGRKIFWSRGNGWVMAGLVRVLQYMPENYPERDKYIDLLRQMAARVVTLQGPDGLWRAGLLAPEMYPAPETSGSALFCYSLAWGLNQGLLEVKQYLPVVETAWEGLVGAVHESGKLGWVQPVGSKPRPVSRHDTELYGVGAFLLAGSEISKLKSNGDERD